MKKGYSIVCIILATTMLLTALAGCNYKTPEPAETSAPEVTTAETTEDMEALEEATTGMLPVFPEGTVVLGVDISNMKPDDAYLAVSNAVMGYTLTVTVNDETVTYTAEDLGVGLTVISFNGMLFDVSRDPDALANVDEEIFTFDEDCIINAVNNFPGITSTAQDAYIKYDKAAKRFVVEPEVNGYGIDPHPIIDAMKEAVINHETELSMSVEASDVIPNLTRDCDKVQNALSRANAVLTLNITYVFDPDTGSKHSDRLSVADISSLIYVKSDGLTIAVDGDSLDRFCAKKARERSVFGESVTFTTTGGQALNMNAIATGELVDTNDLYNDLNYRLSNCVSGTHNVVYYVVRPGDVSGNYDGNYIEVNLTQQHLWCYKGGALICSTDIVSGCVREGHKTPTGVFTIRAKARDTYLVGPTWRSFVNYWMPFNGGIGLHDADRWRRSYGGNIYINNGSHGCVNMPKSAAATIFNNMPRGTHVIVYGGQGNSSSPQAINGTSQYYKNVGDAPFMLDARPVYTATMTFSSSNSSVVTVDRSGKVTIHGEGTATITVKTDDTSKSITIVVLAAGVNIQEYLESIAAATASSDSSEPSDSSDNSGTNDSSSSDVSGDSSDSSSNDSSSESSSDSSEQTPSQETPAPETPSQETPAPESSDEGDQE